MPGLFGALGLLGLTCLLKEPDLPWSDGLFLNPGLFGMPDLFGVPGMLEAVCLKEMFCLLFWLLFFLRESSFLMGAPTSSGVFNLLLFFNLGLFVIWSSLFDIFLLSPEL